MNTDFNADAARDPDSLEREIDEQRREINETLRALEEKFSSREIANQFMQYLGDPGRQWMATLGSSVKANPVPTLLTAIGVSWLMMSDRNGANRAAYAHPYAATGEGRGRFEGAAASAHDATDTMMRKAHEMGDRAEHVGEALHEKAAHTHEALRSRASHARDGLHHVADVGDNFAHMIKEQPLALGAIGIALGALLGAALPRTEQERRVLGEASERVMEKGREMAREGYRKASQKVDAVVEAAEESFEGTAQTTEGDLGPADATAMQPGNSTPQGSRPPTPGGPGLG